MISFQKQILDNPITVKNIRNRGLEILIVLPPKSYSGHLISPSFNLSKFSFLWIRNFKFLLRLDIEDAPITTYYSSIQGEKSNIEMLAKLKEMNVDILKAFTEDCFLYYYDPNCMWRLNCDFKQIFSSLGDN